MPCLRRHLQWRGLRARGDRRDGRWRNGWRRFRRDERRRRDGWRRFWRDERGRRNGRDRRRWRAGRRRWWRRWWWWRRRRQWWGGRHRGNRWRWRGGWRWWDGRIGRRGNDRARRARYGGHGCGRLADGQCGLWGEWTWWHRGTADRAWLCERTRADGKHLDGCPPRGVRALAPAQRAAVTRTRCNCAGLAGLLLLACSPRPEARPEVGSRRASVVVVPESGIDNLVASPPGALAVYTTPPASAFDGTNHAVVFAGDRGPTMQRVSAAGALLDAPGTVLLASAPVVTTNPPSAPTIIFVLDRYLVTWLEGAVGASTLRAGWFAPDGTALLPPVRQGALSMRLRFRRMLRRRWMRAGSPMGGRPPTAGPPTAGRPRTVAGVALRVLLPTPAVAAWPQTRGGRGSEAEGARLGAPMPRRCRPLRCS